MKSKPNIHEPRVPRLADAIKTVIRVLEAGAKTHEPGAWRRLSVTDHIRHACAHLAKTSDVAQLIDHLNHRDEDHLAHAACRLLMALELREEQKAYDRIPMARTAR